MCSAASFGQRPDKLAMEREARLNVVGGREEIQGVLREPEQPEPRRPAEPAGPRRWPARRPAGPEARSAADAEARSGRTAGWSRWSRRPAGPEQSQQVT